MYLTSESELLQSDTKVNKAIMLKIFLLLTWLSHVVLSAPHIRHYDSSLSLPLDEIQLPPGFNISIYADAANNSLTQPRALKVVEYNGATIVYVATFDAEDRTVRALIDYDSDNTIDDTVDVFTGQWWEIGAVTINPENGNMYCAEPNQTYICSGNINEKVYNKETPVKCEEWFYMFYNNSDDHYLHYMDINPVTNDLCIAFGTNCNECIRPFPYGTLQCFEDNQVLSNKVYAYGIRNSVGFDWHPITNNIWFTDNGRDNIGLNRKSPYDTNNHPDDELNYIYEPGLNFGYPYCHSGGTGNPYKRDIESVYKIIDPDEGDGNTNNCSLDEITLSYQPLGPHVAALGLKFYQGDMFPDEYKNAMFIAEHGSWDRMPLIGYRIVALKMQGNDTITEHEIFAQGWLNNQTENVWGRVNGIEFLPDGSMIVSDDQANVIYRISYSESDVDSEDDSDVQAE